MTHDDEDQEHARLVAVQECMAEQDRRALAGEARCPTTCDHGSQCLLRIGHFPTDRHETEHGCICYDPRAKAATDFLDHSQGAPVSAPVDLEKAAALCAPPTTQLGMVYALRVAKPDEDDDAADKPECFVAELVVKLEALPLVAAQLGKPIYFFDGDELRAVLGDAIAELRVLREVAEKARAFSEAAIDFASSDPDFASHKEAERAFDAGLDALDKSLAALLVKP